MLDGRSVSSAQRSWPSCRCCGRPSRRCRALPRTRRRRAAGRRSPRGRASPTSSAGGSCLSGEPAAVGQRLLLLRAGCRVWCRPAQAAALAAVRTRRQQRRAALLLRADVGHAGPHEGQEPHQAGAEALQGGQEQQRRCTAHAQRTCCPPTPARPLDAHEHHNITHATCMPPGIRRHCARLRSRRAWRLIRPSRCACVCAYARVHALHAHRVCRRRPFAGLVTLSLCSGAGRVLSAVRPAARGWCLGCPGAPGEGAPPGHHLHLGEGGMCAPVLVAHTHTPHPGASSKGKLLTARCLRQTAHPSWAAKQGPSTNPHCRRPGLRPSLTRPRPAVSLPRSADGPASLRHHGHINLGGGGGQDGGGRGGHEQGPGEGSGFQGARGHVHEDGGHLCNLKILSTHVGA